MKGRKVALGDHLKRWQSWMVCDHQVVSCEHWLCSNCVGAFSVLVLPPRTQPNFVSIEVGEPLCPLRWPWRTMSMKISTRSKMSVFPGLPNSGSANRRPLMCFHSQSRGTGCIYVDKMPSHTWNNDCTHIELLSRAVNCRGVSTTLMWLVQEVGVVIIWQISNFPH